MELEVQIVVDPYRDQAKQRLRVFAAKGGVIGRSPDSDWCLPDPQSYVSGRHCEFEFRDDAFWVLDTSRNGVFVNGATDRVGYGRRVRLGDGDRLKVGLYELVVRLRDHGRLVADRPLRPEKDGVQHDGSVPRTFSPQPDSVGGDVPHDPVVDAAGALPSGGADDAADEARALKPPTLHTGSQRVVTLDRTRLREIGLLPPEAQERLIANQFRQIKRALLANAFGKGVPAVTNGRLMMMTSALPGEGKTFSTINLALSLAREKNIDVLMVDADVAKPQISSLFGLEREPGLLEALADDRIDVESLVLRTDVNGLCILPAGRCAEDIATELLSSARMDETAARLGSRYPNRIVLLDSPPLLLTNESRVLTGIAGQVVIVVRAGVTPQAAVTEAISYVGEDKPIGLVLNQSKANAPNSYYGYGAYGYGEYGSAVTDQQARGRQE